MKPMGSTFLPKLTNAVWAELWVPTQPMARPPSGREGGEGADEDTDSTMRSRMITDDGKCGFLVFLMVLTMEQNSLWTQG